MSEFFHAYDLRGKYREQISETEAEKIGKAFGTFIDSERVLVGRDGRTHSEKISSAFIQGIVSTGTKVLDAGMVPSPVVYYGSREMNIPSAVVTASHNPPEYTGFKFSKKGALAMSREGGMADIQKIYESESFEVGTAEVEQINLKEDYIEFVSERIELEKAFEVAVNYGNGVTAAVAPEMLEEIGCRVTGINQEIDGNFPNHLPAPGEEKAQKQLIERMEEHDLGIIFDGDGDRAGFILDEEYITEDEVLSVFSKKVLEDHKGKVVHDLRASKLVKETIKSNQGEAVESRVGHTFISEKIHEDSDIVFAGELSGHYYFPAMDVPWDDGMFAAALMCQIASEEDLSAMLEEMPDYPVSPELRIDCPNSIKQSVVQEIAERFSEHETTTVDGVKIFFDKGWALVRPSNTEPKMSVRCEADTEDDLERILEKVENTVKEAIEQG